MLPTGSKPLLEGRSLLPREVQPLSSLSGLQQGFSDTIDLGIVADTLDLTRAALRRAADGHDVILTSGGVSVGEEDHVKAAVQAEGSLDLWKIAIKPGKPLAFGRIGQAAFVGLPGNPVAAFVTFLVLVRPFLRRCQGASVLQPQTIRLPAAFEWSADSRREFLRTRVDGDGRLALFRHQGSGVLTSTVWADGLAIVEPGRTVAVGDAVPYLSFAALGY